MDEVTIVGGEEVDAPLEGGVGTSTRDAWGKDANEMIIEHLNGLLGHIALMFLGGTSW